MAYGFDDLIETVKGSRADFLKTIEGITSEQWAWQPYPNCKSIGETVAHLVWGEDAMLGGIKSGEQPDYSIAPVGHPSEPQEAMMSKLAENHHELMQYIIDTYRSSPLDTEITVFGHSTKLGTALTSMVNENGYHAGQVAFIRQATDPAWDYYGHMYGYVAE